MPRGRKNGSSSSSSETVQEQEHVRDEAKKRASRRGEPKEQIDALDLFEDSLSTVFNVIQPAHGDPGQVLSYTHANLPSFSGDPVDAPRGLKTTKEGTTLWYRIPSNSTSKLFAHHQWDAGLHLANIIADASSQTNEPGGSHSYSAADVRGQTVLEVGAGTGLTGLVSALMGAKTTVISDYPDPELVANLDHNADACLPADVRARTRCEGHAWGDDAQPLLRYIHPEIGTVTNSHQGQRAGFTRILAADTLWVSSAHSALISSMRASLARRSDARILLVAGFHTGRPAVRRFFELAATPATGTDTQAQDSRGAALVPDWQEPLWAGAWEHSVDGQDRAWQGRALPRRPSPSSSYASPSAEVGTTAERREGEEEEEEELGDIEERSRWVVCAWLRWADLGVNDESK